MLTARRILAVFSILALSGCANQDALMKRQSELESRVESLARGSNLTNQQIFRLAGELKDLQDEVKAADAAVRELRDKVANLRAETDVLLARKAAAPPLPSGGKIELINNEGADAAKGKPDLPSETYMKAFGLYSADRYDEAVEAFSAFIKAYPDSEYAANAQYWIGECYYTRSNLPKALDAFKKVISNYPKGNKVPDAMLKAGYTLFALKQNDSAAAMLESLMKKFPDSPAAAKAAERLGKTDPARSQYPAPRQ